MILIALFIIAIYAGFKILAGTATLIWKLMPLIIIICFFGWLTTVFGG